MIHPVTQSHSTGLLHLVRITNFVDVDRKYFDSVWTFFLCVLFNLCPLILQLTDVRTPILQTNLTQGIENVTLLLLGYEVRVASSLYELWQTELDTCLSSHLDVVISAVLPTI